MFEFSIKEEGVTLDKYIGTKTDIIIPSNINDIPVYAIRQGCFSDTLVEKVTVPCRLYYIGSKAFFRSNIKEFIATAPIANINKYAFAKSSLECIHLSSFPDKIDHKAFKDSNLKEFIIDQKFTSIPFIGSDVFGNTPFMQDKNSFEGIYISPDNKHEEFFQDIEVIPSQSCYKSKLNTIIIPPEVHYLGADVFKDSLELNTAIILANIPAIPENTFYNCMSLINVALPETVQELNPNAFRDCKSLLSIQIPDSTKVIGNRVFAGCSNLKSINLNNVSELGSNAFNRCENLYSVRGANLKTVQNGAFSDCIRLNEVYLPNIEHLGTEVFSNCVSLNTITFGENLTHLSYDTIVKSRLKRINLYRSTSVDPLIPEKLINWL